MHLQSADSVAVKFTMIGYKPKVRILRHPKGKQTLQVVLFTDDNTLAEVQVTGQKIQTGQTEELKRRGCQTRTVGIRKWRGRSHPATGWCKYAQ